MHCKGRKRGKKSRKPPKRKKAWGAARKRQEQATSSNPVTHDHQRIMSLVRIKKKDPEKEIIKHAIDAKHANDANHSIILIA